MKYKLPLLFLFLFVSILVLSPIKADAACSFDSANSDAYFQDNVTGTKPQDNLPAYEYNNRYYATPDAASQLASCLGGTVTTIPSGFVEASPYKKPDALGVKLPNGQVINAGDALTVYLAYGADTGGVYYSNWINYVNLPDVQGGGNFGTSGISGGKTISSSGGTGASASTPEGQAAAIKQQIVAATQTLINIYKQNLSKSSQTVAGSIVSRNPTGQQTVTNSCPQQMLTDLAVGDYGNGVTNLTEVLVKEGFLSATQPGFDQAVFDAVIKYQNKYASQILTPLGLNAGTGFVGASTRAHINSNCSAGSSTNPKTTSTSSGSPASPTTSTPSGTKTSNFSYAFTKVGDMWKVTLDNASYGNPTDHWYIPANYSITKATKADLNLDAQGRFNTSFYIPGTPEGNTFYSEMFSAFIRAYYDWDNQTKNGGAVGTGGLTGSLVQANPVTQINPSTTDYLSANNFQSITVRVGEVVTYAWNAVGGTSYESFYKANKPDTCPGGFTTEDMTKPWIANTKSGSTFQTIMGCQAGVSYTITYKIHYMIGLPDSTKIVVVNVTN